MCTLKLSDNEQTCLFELLQAYLAKLPHEIHQTDSREYRDMLEEKQRTIQEIQTRLQSSLIATP